jgi:hypothetical protein
MVCLCATGTIVWGGETEKMVSGLLALCARHRQFRRRAKLLQNNTELTARRTIAAATRVLTRLSDLPGLQSNCGTARQGDAGH